MRTIALVLFVNRLIDRNLARRESSYNSTIISLIQASRRCQQIATKKPSDIK